MSKVYLDYAASTPVDPLVIKAMTPYFDKIFANPHSLHQFGQEASRAIFEARKKIAKSIGAGYGEIVFTGSATEANNLAIRGVIKASKLKNPRIVTTMIEHESVLETCRDLERDGIEVVYIPVSRDGLVDLKKLKAALNERTVLVSIMHANNEIGTVQPIAEVANLIKQFKTLTLKPHSLYPLLHTDAVQSFQYLDCDVNRLGVDPVRGSPPQRPFGRASAGETSNGVDLMTLSAHKIYGPKGIGALYVRSQVASSKQQVVSAREKTILPTTNYLLPIITGSGQEGGLRSGTDNVPYIVGFGEAVEIAMKMREKESKRIKELRDYFWKNLKRKLPRLLVNGSMKERLPNNINIYFPGFQAQDLLIRLDLAGIATSPGAACSTRVSKISYVLEALGFPEERAGGSLRFSLGRQTTKGDINYAIDKIRKIVL